MSSLDRILASGSGDWGWRLRWNLFAGDEDGGHLVLIRQLEARVQAQELSEGRFDRADDDSGGGELRIGGPVRLPAPGLDGAVDALVPVESGAAVDADGHVERPDEISTPAVVVVQRPAVALRLDELNCLDGQ